MGLKLWIKDPKTNFGVYNTHLLEFNHIPNFNLIFKALLQVSALSL